MTPPRLHRLAAVASTQEAARQLAREGAPPFTAVLAEAQTGGRGRHGRAWYSAPGLGMYLSIVLPPMPARQLVMLGLASAVAVREAIVAAVPAADPRLVHVKWPNDVVSVEGRKLAGLLLEAESGRRTRAVLGIGVNLGHGADDFPPELRRTATSVRLLLGHAPRPDVLAADLQVRLATWSDRLVARGFASIREALLQVIYPPLASDIVVEDGAARCEGTFEGLDGEGALLLRMGASVRVLHVGDVSVRTLR